MIPWIRSSVRTREVDVSQYTPGICTSSSPSKLTAKRSALRETAAALEAACVAGEARTALALRDSLPALVERSLAAYPVRLSGGG